VDLTLLAPVLIGLAASVHCIGMCGGIIGALSLSLPPEVRANKPLLLTYTVSYSLGRIASYALAGALVGSLGQGLFGTLSPAYGHTLLRVFAALLLIGMGFYLAGWFSRFAQLEKIGVPLWRRIEPLGQRLLPVRSPLRAMAFGLIWGGRRRPRQGRAVYDGLRPGDAPVGADRRPAGGLDGATAPDPGGAQTDRCDPDPVRARQPLVCPRRACGTCRGDRAR